MAYEQFMFDEAFEFHDEYKKIASQIKPNEEESYTLNEDQRLPPLGACSNELADDAAISPTGLVFTHTFFLF